MRGVANGLQNVVSFHAGLRELVEMGNCSAIVDELFYRFGYIHIRSGDNRPVKPTRPPLVQFWKQSTGGTSGLHRAA
jgi:hypothetical protein